MNEKTRNTVVGFTTLIGIAGFGWLVMIFGEMPRWTRTTYPVTIQMDNAKGLAAGSRVKLNGVDIGEIDQIRLMPDLARGVEVTAQVLEKFDVPRHSSVTASSGPLGGAATVDIVPLAPAPGAPGTPTGMLPKDGSARLTGQSSDMSSMIQRLEGQLKGQFDNLNLLTKKVEEFADTYIALGKDMRSLVEQRAPSDVDSGKFVGNLSTVLARADERVAELKDAIAGMNSLLGDKQLHADVRETVQNAKEMTVSAKQLAADAGQKLDQLTRKAVATADDLGKALGNLDALITDARNGKGTVGKLLQDPAMYDNFTDAAARLSDAVKELRLLIQKWKAEGLPVQF